MPDPKPLPRAKVAPIETPGISGLMTLATAVVVIAALSVAREVLIPITLAVLLSFVLAPLAELLRRLRLGRMQAAVLAVVLALAVILSLGGVIGAQVAGLAPDVPRYASTIQGKISWLQGATVGRLSGVLGRLSNPLAPAAPRSAPTQPSSGTAPPPTPVEIRQPPSSGLDVAESLLAPLLGPLATTGIVFVVAMFVLLQQDDLRDRLIRLFGSADLHRTTTALDDAARRLSRYFVTQLALNATFGVLIAGGLFVIGVPSPVLWGIVAALMRFVPYVGALLSAGIPLALAAAVDPGWSMVGWTAVLFLVGETVMGQVAEPLAYSHSTGLSPISVVISAIFWGWLWGPIGLILSMPLTLCLVVLGRHVDRLAFLDVLLGDRPALTPVQSFYQRILAGDVDEVQDYAEQLLKQRSLSSYYDEVAIKGLELAAADAERGVLTDQQLERIGESVETLLSELAEYPDVDPEPSDNDPAGPTRDERELHIAPAAGLQPLPGGLAAPPDWLAPSAVLCIAGRGPLDAAASQMLAQLLTKHDLGATVLPHAAVASRYALAAIEVSEVRMVCLTTIGPSGSPTNLRYALRRLRARLPGVPVLVGLWQVESAADERLRAAVAADRYAATLRDSVNLCLQQARLDVAPGPGGVADAVLLVARAGS